MLNIAYPAENAEYFFKNLKAGDRVVIQRSSYTTKMIRLEEGTFFEVLRSKLGSVER